VILRCPHPPTADAAGPPSPAVREREVGRDASEPLSRTAGEGATTRNGEAGEGFGGPASIGSLISETAARLETAGFDDARRRARRLVEAALSLSRSEVFAYPERKVGTEDAARAGQLLRRVLAHEPLSRILGTREFWGLEFRLSFDTLDPRPETETVVEAVLARLPDRSRPYRFLDLGTGTGCLLLALLSEFPNAIGAGADLSPGAAATARDNARALGLAGRASFVVANWAAPLAGAFDVVIANPPYIATGAIPDLPPEVREHDPLLALDGGADGLAAYRAIAANLPCLLALGGFFATEIGAGQAAGISEILEGAGLQIEGVAADLAGIPRCVVARPEKRGPARK